MLLTRVWLKTSTIQEARIELSAGSMERYEISSYLSQIQSLQLKDFSDQDAATAVVELVESANSKSHYYFLLPSCGGFVLKYKAIVIKTITQSSAIGEELDRAMVGDEISIALKTGFKEYTIKSIF